MFVNYVIVGARLVIEGEDATALQMIHLILILVLWAYSCIITGVHTVPGLKVGLVSDGSVTVFVAIICDVQDGVVFLKVAVAEIKGGDQWLKQR